MKKTNIISLIFAGFLLAGYTPAAQADFAGVVNFLEKAPWASTKNALIYAGVNFGSTVLGAFLVSRSKKNSEKIAAGSVVGGFATALNAAGTRFVPKGFGNLMSPATFGAIGWVMSDFDVGIGLSFFSTIPVAAALVALYFFGDKV